MNKLFLFLVLGMVFPSVYAQKPLIDTSMYGKFYGGPGRYNISNDGKYIGYDFIDKKGCNHTLIESVDRLWKKEIEGHEPLFTDNSKFVVYIKGTDSLCLQSLGGNGITFIQNVGFFKIPHEGSGDMLAYQLNSPHKELILRNLSTQKERSFQNIKYFEFDNKGKALFFQQQVNDSTVTLNRLNIVSGLVSSIWQGYKISQLIFSADGSALAIVEENSNNSSSILEYKVGEKKASQLFPEKTTRQGKKDGKIYKLLNFNSSDTKLFFSLKQRIPNPAPDPSLASIDIYSYKDAKLQSQQLDELSDLTVVSTYVCDLTNHTVIPLIMRNEHVIGEMNNRRKQDFILVAQNKGGNDNEWRWNPASLYSIYLVSTSDGVRKNIAKKIAPPLLNSYSLSPNDKYLVYYNPGQKAYYSYNIGNGVVTNITRGFKTTWLNDNGSVGQGWPDSAYEVAPNFRWVDNDAAVLIESDHDIIQADPLGRLAAYSLTDNYGPKHHLQFETVLNEDRSDLNDIQPARPLLYQAINLQDKTEGFCTITAGMKNEFRMMKMQPFHMGKIQKARDAEVCGLTLESAENCPNLFITRDFQNYQQLTNIHPEKAYNWLTAELIHWKVPSNGTTQGILYKPENFDPKKKYPVIFYYYEKLSGQLHYFFYPQYCDDGDLDIPYYVSNGYLVCVPDIYYQLGYPGKSACSTVTAAANYLTQYHWVDKTHMGLMGHSFGSYETNYIVTHSHLFAAAISAAGVSDFISAYNSVSFGDGEGRNDIYENHQSRIGATLWERLDLYIQNSPIIDANHVTTPVLLVSNKNDGIVPCEQGFEFFIALRRLEKRAWLLQYDNEGHNLYKGLDQKDYTLRSHQFFDYYLKGKGAPEWMVSGVPESNKKTDSGLEPDLTGRKP